MKKLNQKLFFCIFIFILLFYTSTIGFAEDILLNPYKQNIACPILVYHNLNTNSDIAGSWTITPEKFQEDMKLLLENNYTPIFTQELQQSFLGQFILPEKPVIIQFDDGYSSFYHLAYPILKKYNIKAEVYIVTDFTKETPFFNGNNEFLSWTQLREMENSQLVRTYLHGKSHDSVKQFSLERLYEDYNTAQQMIKNNLGERPSYYVYPNGEYTLNTLQTIDRTGDNIQFIWFWNMTSAIKNYNVLPRTNIEYTTNVIEAIQEYNKEICLNLK